MFNPKNWYWSVAGSTTQVYSSASSSYVNVTDSTYEAWLATGKTLTKISANDMLLMQIQFLEDSVTERMKQEAQAGTTNVFPAGTTFAGLTAAQAIAEIVSQKAVLRAQLQG